MKVLLAVGTRPQIIKSAPLIKELSSRSEIDLSLVHTGQHYDYEMSKIFFDELSLPEPSFHLGVGSGSNAEQTGKILLGLEKVLRNTEPRLVLVPGDTNSALASGLAAAQLRIPVGHIEAGARSFDSTMIEELNRVLLDHLSSLLFAPTKNCSENLVSEGVPERKIDMTGDTLLDALLEHLRRVDEGAILKARGLRKRGYILLTVHREANSNERSLEAILNSACSTSTEVVFPAHPRIVGLARTLKEKNHYSELSIIDPVSYNESLVLCKNALIVMTDSGGLQKEAYWMKRPCIVMRDSTEWIETLRSENNVLTGASEEKITNALHEIRDRDVRKDEEEYDGEQRSSISEFGDGNASARIADRILCFLSGSTASDKKN